MLFLGGLFLLPDCNKSGDEPGNKKNRQVGHGAANLSTAIPHCGEDEKEYDGQYYRKDDFCSFADWGYYV